MFLNNEVRGLPLCSFLRLFWLFIVLCGSTWILALLFYFYKNFHWELNKDCTKFIVTSCSMRILTVASLLKCEHKISFHLFASSLKKKFCSFQCINVCLLGWIYSKVLYSFLYYHCKKDCFLNFHFTLFKIVYGSTSDFCVLWS